MLDCRDQVLVKVPEIQSIFTEIILDFCDNVFFSLLIIPSMNWLFAASFMLSTFSTMVTDVRTKRRQFTGPLFIQLPVGSRIGHEVIQ